MTTSRFLFLGFEVDELLRSLISAGDKSDSGYLLDPGYLEEIRVQDDVYIGRRLPEGGVSPGSVEDGARNVRSLLLRALPGWSGKSADVRLLALEEDTSTLDIRMDS
jgi:hypothetical protein